MKSLSTAGLTAALLLLNDYVSAINIGVHGRKRTGRRHFRRADNSTGESGLDDSTDVEYYTNITVGGAPFQVIIDTGSADLWVAGSVSSATATGHTTGVQYAVGGAQGPIKTDTVTFAGYTIPNQAFIEVVPDADHSVGFGLIGFGPSSGSNIMIEMQSASAAPVLDRIFVQNTTTPNYLTVLLGRYEDPTDTFSGNITVGELLDGFTDIEKQPKIPITDVPTKVIGSQHFQVLMDEDGFIGPDGKAISATTEVTDTKNKKQLTAVFDTGFSFTQVPKLIAQDIYSGFKGADLITSPAGDIWVLPCDIEVNVTIKLGGQSYPIHPLDTSLEPSFAGYSNITNSEGDPACLGTFQPLSFDRGSVISYDIILGMSVIRNAYMLFDFGDFVDGGDDKSDPYLQLLSTTDPAEAHSDFVSVRLGGIDTTGDNKANTTDTTDSHEDKEDKANHTTLYIIIGAVAGAVILGTIGAFFLARARRDRRNKIGAGAKYSALGHPEGMAGVSGPPVYNSTYSTTAYNPDQAYDHPYDSTAYPFSNSNTQFSSTQFSNARH